MNSVLRQAVEAALEAKFGSAASVGRASPVGGGCINDTFAIETSHGPFFVKSRANAPKGFFSRESDGLAMIAATQTVRVPLPVVASEELAPAILPGDAPQFLILEHIESQPPARDFAESLGQALAGMHRNTRLEFGLAQDNFIGLTPQSNKQTANWPEFFGRERLEFQLELMEKRSRATAELRRLMGRLLSRLDGLVGAHAPAASLLHGDLWSGNIMTDAMGRPVLVDPAAYYGDREADLAMTELFGVLDSRFYEAYTEAWPLPDGHEERKEIYNLYHLMNHVNLFGLSYLGGVLAILRRFA